MYGFHTKIPKNYLVCVFLYIQLNIQFLFKITGYFEHIFRLVSFTSIVCVFYYSRLQERKHKERKKMVHCGVFSFAVESMWDCYSIYAC